MDTKEIALTTFQIASDLHLEFYTNGEYPELKPVSPYLLLAGDIGYPFHHSYKDYLKTVSPQYQKIFIISGNHEYYQMDTIKRTMGEIDQEISNICNSFNNVFYLNNKSYELDNNIVILGSTLWTHIPNHLQTYISGSINDYKNIYKTNSLRVTASDTSLYCKINVDWLTRELNKYKDKKVVVLTHHLPSETYICPQYKGSLINYAFMTNLDHLFKEPVVLWTAGHTHHCINTTKNGIKCIVNPLGYPGENDQFQNDLFITIM